MKNDMSISGFLLIAQLNVIGYSIFTMFASVLYLIACSSLVYKGYIAINTYIQDLPFVGKAIVVLEADYASFALACLMIVFGFLLMLEINVVARKVYNKISS